MRRKADEAEVLRLINKEFEDGKPEKALKQIAHCLREGYRSDEFLEAIAVLLEQPPISKRGAPIRNVEAEAFRIWGDFVGLRKTYTYEESIDALADQYALSHRSIEARIKETKQNGLAEAYEQYVDCFRPMLEHAANAGKLEELARLQHEYFNEGLPKVFQQPAPNLEQLTVIFRECPHDCGSGGCRLDELLEGRRNCALRKHQKEDTQLITDLFS